MVIDWPEVEPQVTSRPPRFKHSSEPLKVSGPTCSKATSTPFLPVSLRVMLRNVGLVIDDVIGAERFGLLRLGVVADGGDDGAADGFRHLNCARADAGAAGLDQNGLARFELGIVEQHVLHGAEGDRRAGGVAEAHARRNWHHKPRRHIDQVAGKTVDMEAHDRGDVFAEIVAALAAGLARSARQRAVSDDAVARLAGRSHRAQSRRFRRPPRRRR